MFGFPKILEFLLSGFIETICVTRPFTNTETTTDYKLTRVHWKCLIAISSNPRIILVKYLAKSVSSQSPKSVLLGVYVWASTYTYPSSSRVVSPFPFAN